MKPISGTVLLLLLACICAPAGAQQYLGNYSSNPYDPNSVSNAYGAGSPYRADSITNAYGIYGSPYSDRSVTNPYATNAPRLYDGEGNYRGRLSANPYDSDSVSNPYGKGLRIYGD